MLSKWTNRVLRGENLDILPQLPADSIDCCICDPPYGIKFMNKKWDHDVPGVDNWKEVFRVLKPGAYLLAFFGTRTYHRGVINIEDAGFEIRDQIAWVYGSGFPKSVNISKAIDKELGAIRGKKRVDGDIAVTDEATRWDGWGTALKPAHEPIVIARKPFAGTVARNVLQQGTAALNIGACKVPFHGDYDSEKADTVGRWPANLIHDGSDEVLECFPDAPGQLADAKLSGERKTANVYGKMRYGEPSEGATNFAMKPGIRRGDKGTAARFFYAAKASKKERGELNIHPTVKPLALIRYLVRLVCPPGGVALDPYFGSGTLGLACREEGFDWIGIERDDGSCEIANRRLGVTA